MLPPNAENAWRLCCERLGELSGLAANLSTNALPDAVKSGCKHLREIAANF
jgi:hypothetical protein